MIRHVHCRERSVGASNSTGEIIDNTKLDQGRFSLKTNNAELLITARVRRAFAKADCKSDPATKRQNMFGEQRTGLLISKFAKQQDGDGLSRSVSKKIIITV